MKILMTFFCSAVFVCAAIAQDASKIEADKSDVKTEESVVKVEGGRSDIKPESRIRRQRMRRDGVKRQRPMMFVITEKTTVEQIEAFKKEVCSKIDEAAKSFADQEGEKKRPKSIMLFVNDRVVGQREGSMRRGPREDVSRPVMSVEAKK